jgi:head-tail adaptor
MPFPAYVINPGELRHKVEIQAASTAPDSRGLSVAPTTWTAVLTTRAKIESIGAAAYKQTVKSGALTSESTDLITIRWPGASIVIRPNMRIVFGTNIFLIQAVDNVEHRNRILKLACMQVAADSN